MDRPASGGVGVMLALAAFIAASAVLGALAQRRVRKGEFLQGYFLGNRALGAWALALTATVQSGGTFMGFPSLVYSYGWIVALWIAGYMVVPLTGFAVVGKRLAQLSRHSGAITVPDLLRERFDSPAAALLASLLIIVFMSSMMVAQFKAGAIVMGLAWPDADPAAVAADDGGEGADGDEGAEKDAGPKRASGLDRRQLVGLVVFSVVVVGYTMFGGFLASVWTDLFQSVMMLVGVVILALLVVPAAGGLEQATRTAVANTSPGFAFGPGHAPATSPDGWAFLPSGLAVSFFVLWVFSGIGSPASIVRVMATESTQVLRRSVFLLACYNCLIYVPLIVICVAGRALIPDLRDTDQIIPRLALGYTGQGAGAALMSGLILAAPFGAVMATVSCYLVVIASGLVKDVYLRFVRPHAPVAEIRRVTYAAMIIVGLVAVALNIRPVQYLQVLVVFSGASGAATFVVPILMAAYWRRGTGPGVVAAMAAGSGTMFLLYFGGWIQRSVWTAVANGSTSPLVNTIAETLGREPLIGIAGGLRPYYLLGLDPILWALPASLAAGVVVSLTTSPPDPARVSRYFDVVTR